MSLNPTPPSSPPDFRLKNHYVICNWNSRIIEIVKQLHVEILEKTVIVIVTERPIDRSLLPHTAEGRDAFEDVLFSPGDPTQPHVLRRVNCQHATGVLVLAEDELGDEADARNLLTLFSLCELDLVDGSRPHIVVEIRDVANYRKFQQFESDKDRDIEIIRAESLRTRILAQGARTPGLIEFFKELLTFSADSNEIYAIPVPRHWFGAKATMSYDRLVDIITGLRNHPTAPFVGVPIGLLRASDRRPELNPAETATVYPEDAALIICIRHVDLSSYPIPEMLK